MATLTLKERAEVNHFELNGNLDFDTVAELARDSAQLFAEAGDVQVDLAGVGQANSAALALLLEWQAMAHRRGASLSCINIPPLLMNLAKVSKVDGFLGA